ncbi:MAG: glycosyltransferase family 2 protein [Vicinamibacterales bacterium]|nr:glycosyltransferase family 2 protein [Vicinamibacterales bacterium]
MDLRHAAIAVVIPALNEAASITRVIDALPLPAASVIVADNGSTDATAALAAAAGARVVREPQRGYGAACLAALAVAGDARIIVFLDADFSERPEQLVELVAPILDNRADFVLGRRVGHGRPWHALAGTWLCVTAINRLWGTGYRDLGPFRAIRKDALDRLQMQDRTWGWTIEMQVKAAEAGLLTLELPVTTRPRIGQSKISGTVRGTVRAATKMLATIARLGLTRGQRRFT